MLIWEEVEREVKQGQFFQIVSDPSYAGDIYIVAKVTSIGYCLINLATGNRWEDPVALNDNELEKLFEEDKDDLTVWTQYLPGKGD